MKKIKIAHIITRLDKGGSAENVLLTCIGLDKNEYDCTLIYGRSQNQDRQLVEEAKRNNVKLIYVPSLIRSVNPVKDMQAFIKLFYCMLKGRYDIVHTHTSKAGILGRWAAKLGGVPVIVHSPHGHIFYGYFNSFITRIFILLEKITALITDNIITLTERGRDDHVKLAIGPREKFEVIPSGIEIDRCLNSKTDIKVKRRELGLPEDLPIVGSIGRLVPIKGYIYFIEAINLVLKEMQDVHFLLAGKGSEENLLKCRVREMKIEDKVTFLGWRDDLIDIFNILDVFILSSINEGMGKVVIEAMACGKPVVATMVGGVPEIVIDGETGILASPRDPKGLKDAMITILRDKKLREKMSQAGRGRIDSYFSIENMVKMNENVYKKNMSKLTI